MQLIEPSRRLVFDATPFVSSDDPALDAEDDRPDGLEEATAAVLAAIAARVEAMTPPPRLDYAALARDPSVSGQDGEAGSSDDPADQADDFAAGIDLEGDSPATSTQPDRPISEREAQWRRKTAKMREERQRRAASGPSAGSRPRSADSGRPSSTRPDSGTRPPQSRPPQQSRSPQPSGGTSSGKPESRAAAVRGSLDKLSEAADKSTSGGAPEASVDDSDIQRTRSRRRRRRRGGGAADRVDASAGGETRETVASENGVSGGSQPSLEPNPSNRPPSRHRRSENPGGSITPPSIEASGDQSAETGGAPDQGARRGRRRGRRRGGRGQTGGDSSGAAGSGEPG